LPNGHWGPRKSADLWGRAEASVARRLSVAVLTFAISTPNAKNQRKIFKKKKRSKKRKIKNGSSS